MVLFSDWEPLFCDRQTGEGACLHGSSRSTFCFEAPRSSLCTPGFSWLASAGLEVSSAQLLCDQQLRQRASSRTRRSSEPSARTHNLPKMALRRSDQRPPPHPTGETKVRLEVMYVVGMYFTHGTIRRPPEDHPASISTHDFPSAGPYSMFPPALRQGQARSIGTAAGRFPLRGNRVLPTPTHI